MLTVIIKCIIYCTVSPPAAWFIYYTHHCLFTFYHVRTYICVLTLAALFTVFSQGPRALGIPSSLLVGVSRHAPGVMKDSEGKFVVPKVDL